MYVALGTLSLLIRIPSYLPTNFSWNWHNYTTSHALCRLTLYFASKRPSDATDAKSHMLMETTWTKQHLVKFLEDNLTPQKITQHAYEDQMVMFPRQIRCSTDSFHFWNWTSICWISSYCQPLIYISVIRRNAQRFPSSKDKIVIPSGFFLI